MEHRNIYATGGAERHIKGSPNLLRFMLWLKWIYAANVMGTHPIIANMFLQKTKMSIF